MEAVTITLQPAKIVKYAKIAAVILVLYLGWRHFTGGPQPTPAPNTPLEAQQAAAPGVGAPTGTGVFVNGRELSVTEVANAQRQGVPVQQGRWWMDAQGNYGREGGPMMGNVAQLGQGAGNNGYYKSTQFGDIGSDGKTSYFYDRASGTSVMTGGD